jgi:hypothetical protein
MTRRAWTHVAVWSVLYVFWLIVTRGNQPTLPVATVATLILVGTAAAALYSDWVVLRPRFAAHGRWAVYAVGLMVVVAALAFPTVQAIQWVYDVADVPKDGRFGFRTNVGYEVVWYAVHLAGGAIVLAVGRRNAKQDAGQAGWG